MSADTLLTLTETIRMKVRLVPVHLVLDFISLIFINYSKTNRLISIDISIGLKYIELN